MIFLPVAGFTQSWQRESQVSLSSRNSFLFTAGRLGGGNTKSTSFQSFVLGFETCFHSKTCFPGSELKDMDCPGTEDLSIWSTEFHFTL